MSILITCPECDRGFTVPDEYAGKRGKCPKCGSVFHAPAAPRGGNGAATRGAPHRDSGIRDSGSFDGLDGPAEGNGHDSTGHSGLGLSLDGGGNGFDGPAEGDGDFGLVTSAPGAPASPPARKAASKSSPKARPARGEGGGGGGGMPIWGWLLLAAVTAAGGISTAVVYNYSKLPVAPDPVKTISENEKKIEERIAASEKVYKDLQTNLAAAEERKKQGLAAESTADLEPLKEGVVKVIKYRTQGKSATPDPITASGVIINDQQWIVTTHRICENAARLEVMSHTKTPYQVEGMLIGIPEQDLAIIKPAAIIPGVTTAKLAAATYMPKFGEIIYSVGCPARHLFTVSRGNVTRILSKAALAKEDHQFDIKLREDKAKENDFLFVEHSAKTFLGAYGGPVFTVRKDGKDDIREVIAVNGLSALMVLNDGRTRAQTFTSAPHVKHIHDLIKLANATVQPYPKFDDKDDVFVDRGPGAKSKKPSPKKKPTPKDDEPGEDEPSDEEESPKEKGKEKGKEKENEEPSEEEGDEEATPEKKPPGKKTPAKPDKPKAKEKTPAKTPDKTKPRTPRPKAGEAAPSDDELDKHDDDPGKTPADVMDRMKKLAARCKQYAWTPSNEMEYQHLSNFAQAVSTAAKMQQDTKVAEADRTALKTATDAALEEVAAGPWKDEAGIQQLNEHIAEREMKPKRGVFLVGTLVGKLPDGTDPDRASLVFKVPGAKEHYNVFLDATEAKKMKKNSSWVILAVYTEAGEFTYRRNGGRPIRFRVVRAFTHLPLKGVEIAPEEEPEEEDVMPDDE